MIQASIQGIPCQIEVTTYTRTKGSFSYHAPSDLDYYGYTELEFEVYDRKGYRARWLEAKMDDKDVARITDLVERHMEDVL